MKQQEDNEKFLESSASFMFFGLILISIFKFIVFLTESNGSPVYAANLQKFKGTAIIQAQVNEKEKKYISILVLDENQNKVNCILHSTMFLNQEDEQRASNEGVEFSFEGNEQVYENVPDRIKFLFSKIKDSEPEKILLSRFSLGNKTNSSKTHLSCGKALTVNY